MKDKESKSWQYTSDIEKETAEHIIALELSALEKWSRGDVSGYAQLWSKRSFTYFDAVVTKRMDKFEDMDSLFDRVQGKLSTESYEVVDPRVQLGKDMGILTYQLFSKSNLIDIEYNCVEVFQKEEDGQWYVIHSTWSVIRPMDKDFGVFKDVV